VDGKTVDCNHDVKLLGSVVVGGVGGKVEKLVGETEGPLLSSDSVSGKLPSVAAAVGAERSASPASRCFGG